MKTAYVMDFPGVTAAQYDETCRRIGVTEVLPPGGIFHAAGTTGTGWRVVDVWESPEIFQAFLEERLGPATAEIGLPQPAMQEIALHNFEWGANNPMEFLQVVRLPGLDATTYDGIHREVKREHGQLPPGCVVHFAGATGGDFCVIDAWSSRVARDKFIDLSIRPRLADMPTTPLFEDLDLHNTFVGAPATVRA